MHAWALRLTGMATGVTGRHLHWRDCVLPEA